MSPLLYKTLPTLYGAVIIRAHAKFDLEQCLVNDAAADNVVYDENNDDDDDDGKLDGDDKDDVQ